MYVSPNYDTCLKLHGTHLRNLKLFLHALPNLKVMFFKDLSDDNFVFYPLTTPQQGK